MTLAWRQISRGRALRSPRNAAVSRLPCAAAIDLVPLGRVGTPYDAAAAVAFLASDDAAFITGEALNISGGEETH